jgi:hypothetical protein
VDRIGQPRAVHALHLVARGTGEESVVARLEEREARARASLEQIGEAVLRGSEPTAAPMRRPAATPPRNDIARIDLGTEARGEAERLHGVRALIEGDTRKWSRPAVCILRRRARAQGRRFWVWRLTFADDNGRVIWESLLPLGADAARGRATPARARTSLDVRDPGLAAAVNRAQAETLAQVAADIRDGIAVLARREQAVADALESRHARLAAALLQPGLFDRRAERAAAAQASLVREALSRAAARVARLEASGRPVVDERRLVFAVAFE